MITRTAGPDDVRRGVAVTEELTPALEVELRRHTQLAQEWMPHALVTRIGSDGPDSGQALPEVVRSAVVLNLLTEDNLPSYHREAAQAFSVGATGREVWGEWLDTWTAEESRHSLALRDYLHSRSGPSCAFDLDDYERRRMRMLRAGWHPVGKTPLQFLAFVAVQELATRISHRNTGQRGGEQCLDRLLAQIAFDENLHMLLYRNLVDVAMDIDPAAMLAALVTELASFEMPGANEPQFRTVARLMASAGIYNLRIHASDVVAPLLRYWRVFERRLPNEAEPYRELLATGLAQLDLAAVRQSERIAVAGLADGRTTVLSRTT